MSTYFENPFADFGQIVNKERFIGRKSSMQIIENRIFHTDEPGNMAIIGIPSIGKTSLVYRTVMLRKEELLARRVLPIWVNLALYKESKSFFRGLVDHCYEEIQQLGWLTTAIEESAQRVLNGEMHSHTYIQRYFRRVRQAQIRIVFIVDEFDHVQNLFQEAWDFHALRDLAAEPEWQVTFITISFHSIATLQKGKEGYSPLDNVFLTHYLPPFNTTEMQEYANRLSTFGLPIDREIMDHIHFYCGGHPYFLNMLGNTLVDLFGREQRIDVEYAAKIIKSNFFDYTRTLSDLLQERQQFRKLLQILFGPVVDVTQADVNELLKYGLIKSNTLQTTEQISAYSAFSAYFQRCLQPFADTIDLWPLLGDTERALRVLIKKQMHNLYGNQWLQELKHIKPAFFQSKEKLAPYAEHVWQGNSAKDPLATLHSDQLFELILEHWDTFQPILQVGPHTDRAYWFEHAQLIATIRMPLTHNRATAISETSRREAQIFCQELLTALATYQSNETQTIRVILRMVTRVELTRASLEACLTQLQTTEYTPLQDNEKRHIEELQTLLKAALDLRQQETFEGAERQCVHIDTLCQDLLQNIAADSTQLLQEEVAPIVVTIQRKVAAHAEHLAASFTPRVCLRIPKNREFYPLDSRSIEVQVVVENEPGCSPAEALELLVSDNDTYYTLAHHGLKLNQLLRGGEKKFLILSLQITEQALQMGSFSFAISACYLTSTGDLAETAKETFTIRLATDFKTIANPYYRYAKGGIVGNPAMFYGRSELIARLAAVICEPGSQSKAIAIFGQKRVGKSSVLYHLKQRLLLDHDLLVLDVGSIGKFSYNTSESYLSSILFNILELLKYAIADRATNENIPPLEVVFPEEVDFHSHCDPASLFRRLFENFSRQSAKSAIWKNTRVMLLIDEFTYLYSMIVAGQLSRDFMIMWKGFLDANFFSCVLVGQDVMPKFKEISFNAFGRISGEPVGYLYPEDARLLIDEPIRIGGTTGESRYCEQALERIVALTGGNPFYIQIFCRHLVEYMNRKRMLQITEFDVEEVKKILLQGVYALDWGDFDNLINSGDTAPDAISDEDIKKVLLEIALKSSAEGCPRNSITCETQKRLDDILSDLEKRHVVVAKEQHYTILVELFKEWLIAHQ